MQEKPRHKTAVILGTLSFVPNYPKKLKIYLNNASPYWQAVFWDKGKTYRRSSKTCNKLEALIFAKDFYAQILIAKYQTSSHLKNYPEIHYSTYRKEKEHHRFKAIAEQWLARMAARWSQDFRKETERQLEKNVYPYIAEMNINRIGKADILKIVGNMEKRGAYVHSRRVLNVCRQIWRYAIAVDIVKKDPTASLDLTLFKHRTKHQNAVSIEELPKLMQEIAAYDRQGDLISKYALQLIAMTFVRKNELMNAKWNEVDLHAGIWTIPAERMKMRRTHIVPLSKQAIEIFKRIQEEYPSNHYIMHHGDPQKTPRVNALIDALYRLGYKSKMSVHGFRSIASTILNEHGFRADVIERQLAHVEANQVRRAYNHAQYMNERKIMMDWWGDYLEKMSPFTQIR